LTVPHPGTGARAKWKMLGWLTFSLLMGLVVLWSMAVLEVFWPTIAER
jgi:hypothetical protein